MGEMSDRARSKERDRLCVRAGESQIERLKYKREKKKNNTKRRANETDREREIYINRQKGKGEK